MRSFLAAIALSGLLFGLATGQPATSPAAEEPQQPSAWMDVKVQESQLVFAALARADFDAIAQSTKKLKTLSALEGFVRRSTPGYRTQLRSFEFAVDEIQLQAKRQNIEGVALAFNQLTLSCVNCHKLLRHPPPGGNDRQPTEPGHSSPQR